MREYSARAKVWKAGKMCAGSGLAIEGKPICSENPHLCTDVHHAYGRVGSLLMDERFWVPVCPKLHLFIHAHPKESKLWGLIGDGPWNHVPSLLTK
jgi:hypothetical protein